FAMKDESGSPKWVLLISINPGGPQVGSATHYFIGDFDGTSFTSQDTVTRWIDHGADNYAGVTWSGIPSTDGRRLFLGWMSNWQYAQVVPTGVWRSAMTLPREITLVNHQGRYELAVAPVREVAGLSGEPATAVGSAKLSGELNRIEFRPEGKPFNLILSNKNGEQLVAGFADGAIYIDRTIAGRNDFHAGFAAIHRMPVGEGKPSLITIYMDRSSIELFTDSGEVMTDLVFPTSPYETVKLEMQGEGSITVTPMNEIWNKNN
ncbi:MAG: glycoside hydrolase family 32 protein, partial [Bacteroidota bacterium]